MPGARCTRSLVRKVDKHTSVVTTSSPEHPAFPHAMVLTAYFALSPVIGLFCHRRWRKLSSTNLTPASRRQDHTTSPSATERVRQCASSVHRIPPRVRDDRDTPLMWDETAEVIEVIWVRRESEYFCKWGWTGGQISWISRL
jgi:hypothetical protein